MAMLDDLKKGAAGRMQKCVQAFQADLKKLRTGRNVLAPAMPQIIKDDDLVAGRQQLPRHHAANIPSPAGHKKGHRVGILSNLP